MEPTSDFIAMKSSSTESSRLESSLINNRAYQSSHSYEDTPIDILSTTDEPLETEDSPTHRNPGSFQNVVSNPAYDEHRRFFRWPLPSGSDESSYNHLNWGPTETYSRLHSMKSIDYKLLSIAILCILALLISLATVVSLNLELAAVRDELQQIQESNCTTLQNDLNILKSLISSPVDLYHGCFSERRTCDLGPASNHYWRQCSTEELPMDSPGHYTLSTRCEYSSNRFGIFLESAYLRPDDSHQRVWCVCEVTYPDANSTQHFLIPSDATVSCLLSIVRCPSKPALYNFTGLN